MKNRYSLLNIKTLFLFILICCITLFISCKQNNINLRVKKFGFFEDGTVVNKYTLENENGMKVSVINYGATITNLHVPSKNGKLIDVVLGFNDLKSYSKDHPYFGAVIGRFANRIENGEFELNGKIYKLKNNNGTNSLHGGEKGFDKVLWDLDNDVNSKNLVKFKYFSSDMEEGFPGNLEVFVTYKLTNENELIINYEANTDKPTVLNLTQHSYFNLSGESSGSINNHYLSIDADYFLPIKENMIPTGEIRPVLNSPFDFKKLKKIGDESIFNNNQVKIANGYDHCWVINNFNANIKKVATLTSDKTKISMQVYSDLPGIQLYTGNFLDGSIKSKSNNKYIKNSGLCLETQYFPNSPNQKNFPNVVLNAGQKYESTTIYKFTY